jgi:hypothetical protein
VGAGAGQSVCLTCCEQGISEDPIRSSTGPPMHVRQPGFGHAKEKGPGRCRQQRRDLAGIGARQSAGVSVDSNGACRGGSGGAAGRGASRWPSRPAGRSPAGRPAAARRGSPRGIPRAATTRIESTRWRRDRPEVSASTVNRGNEKAPRIRETLRVGGPIWSHSDDYMPKCDDRSSHRSR